MKMLLLGKRGQVGWELQRALSPLGSLIALDRNGGGGLCGDLRDLEGIRNTVIKSQADVVINAAAYTAVDKAETEREQAWLINATAPQVLADAAAETGAWLVHYSTDYVFDGQGSSPWIETALTDPLNEYGRSKLAGEQAIVASGVKHLILRTSWVYGARGGNFAKTMLRLARERETLKVVADQIGAPTGADLIADVTALMLRTVPAKPELMGIYHLAAAGQTSWHGYAEYVFEIARALGQGLQLHSVEAISSAEYPVPAKRPQNSRLDTSRLCETFDLRLPDWHAGVERMLTEYLVD